MPTRQSRRRFVTNVAVAGAASFGALGAGSLGREGKSLAAEPPPEVTTIRFENHPATCVAPLTPEDLLRAEGFTDIRYVDVTEARVRRAEEARQGVVANMIAHGEVDFGRDFAPSHVLALDSGAPVTILAGLHIGCFEVWAKDDIRRIADLKGRTVGNIYGYTGDKPLLSIMASLVGLDPARDIRWVDATTAEPMKLFVEGKIDAFLAVPPLLQEVRARKIGHVVVSSITDHPWSQYYCCMLATGSEFARKYPVATKRVLRAVLKATDLCASQPARVAQLLVDRGHTARFDYVLQALSEIRYDVWREYDAEDTLRFYALRLQEAEMTKSTPQDLIAKGTDWRFLNELKRELKT